MQLQNRFCGPHFLPKCYLQAPMAQNKIRSPHWLASISYVIVSSPRQTLNSFLWLRNTRHQNLCLVQQTSLILPLRGCEDCAPGRLWHIWVHRVSEKSKSQNSDPVVTKLVLPFQRTSHSFHLVISASSQTLTDCMIECLLTECCMKGRRNKNIESKSFLSSHLYFFPKKYEFGEFFDIPADQWFTLF